MNVTNHAKALDFLEININDKVFLYIKNDDNVKMINIKEVLNDFTLFVNKIIKTTHFKVTTVKLHYLELN